MSGLVVGVQSPAEAAAGTTVTVSGNVVTVTGTTAVDDLTLTNECAGGTCAEIIGSDGMLRGEGCSFSTSFSIVCPTPGPAIVQVTLAGGNDEFRVYDDDTISATTVVVSGGPGNDDFNGSAAKETWRGDEGDDVLSPDGISEADEVGPDDFSGGPGFDKVDYLYSFADDVGGKTVIIDDLANDTSNVPADVDNIRSDVEFVAGTNSPDVLTGNALGNQFEGYSGNDTINGLGGNDSINGGNDNDIINGLDGDDTINGAAGADTIDGGVGNDSLYGGSDNDTIVGGAGIDTINGDTTDLLLTGNDIINSVDGEADNVACGPGSDNVSADDIDKIANQAQDSCEAVTLTATPKPPPGPTTTGATLKGKVLDANKARTKAKISIACAAAPCTGKITVKAKKATVAKGSYKVAATKNGKAVLKITKKGKAALRVKAKVKVKVTITPTIGDAATRKFVLKR